MLNFKHLFVLTLHASVNSVSHLTDMMKSMPRGSEITAQIKMSAKIPIRDKHKFKNSKFHIHIKLHNSHYPVFTQRDISRPITAHPHLSSYEQSTD